MPFLNDERPQLQPIDESGELITFRVLCPFAFRSERFFPGKLYVVPCGFETDGASVPRLIPFISGWYVGRAISAAVLHDFLYREGKRLKMIESQAEADLVFLEAMLDTGVPDNVAHNMYFGVRDFGWVHFKEAA